ncbi:MAG: translation initiation factor IF-3 [Candidatus Levybacteria bacterium]|nr:translation initiation factor IF-3 [Candidatus Levybacteria bacterium]
MIKRFKRKHDQTPYFRVNERIFASQLRVLDSEGKQIGVLSKFDALTKARALGLDLVEVAPKAKPPVAKIVDFKKFLYQQAKKRRDEKKKAKISETKEIRLGPFMNDHDLNVMIRRAREFLVNNDKVRLVVRFSGRQIVHPEFGQEILKRVFGAVADIGKIERDPHFEGKQLISLLSPEKKSAKSAEKNENQEVSQQKV